MPARDSIGAPDLIEVRAVRAAVKTALRRLRRWPPANLDRRCARRSVARQVGGGETGL